MSDLHPPEGKPFWLSEMDNCRTTADLLEQEAKTWADGWATKDESGKLVWEKDFEWAKIRHFRLMRAAEWMRAIVARQTKTKGAT